MIKLSINDRYFFNEYGKTFIPSVEELIEYYQLNDRIYTVKEPFPCEGYGVCGCSGSYPTRAAAEKAAEQIKVNVAIGYRERVKICSTK